MNQRFKYSLIFLSALFFVPPLFAYQIYGEGTSSCGECISERSSGNWHSKGQWMLGVISAVGYYGVYDLKRTDSRAFAVWIDNYCQKNPLDDFSKGVYSLIEELAKKKR